MLQPPIQWRQPLADSGGPGAACASVGIARDAGLELVGTAQGSGMQVVVWQIVSQVVWRVFRQPGYRAGTHAFDLLRPSPSSGSFSREP